MPITPIVINWSGEDVNLDMINQDNFASTHFGRHTNGTEIQVKLKHTREAANAAGQVERHVIDVTITEYDSDGIPSVYQQYAHLRAQRSAPTATKTSAIEKLGTLVNLLRFEIVDWKV